MVFHDKLLVMWSGADRRWLAHSTRTNQVGTGTDVIAALADALRAVKSVLAIAAEDRTVEPLHDAPRHIQTKANRATPLPSVVCRLAERVARGDWPSDMPTTVSITPRAPRRWFSADVVLS